LRAFLFPLKSEEEREGYIPLPSLPEKMIKKRWKPFRGRARNRSSPFLPSLDTGTEKRGSLPLSFYGVGKIGGEDYLLPFGRRT